MTAPRPHTLIRVVLLTGILFLPFKAETETISEAEIDASDKGRRHFFETRYQTARTQHQKKPNEPGPAIEFAAAAFDWAELADSSKSREAISRVAVELCEKHLTSPDHQAKARYYLALNLGQIARAKWLGALRIVPRMEKRLLQASALEPHLDHGGPHRALSRLYFQAPGWPTSVGNKRKAKKHAQLAIKVAPNYPGNHLNFLEILLEEGELIAAKEQAKKTTEVMTQAEKTLDTPYWAYNWIEWRQRFERFQDELRAKL